jgi:hypothetical protein
MPGKAGPIPGVALAAAEPEPLGPSPPERFTDFWAVQESVTWTKSVFGSSSGRSSASARLQGATRRRREKSSPLPATASRQVRRASTRLAGERMGEYAMGAGGFADP